MAQEQKKILVVDDEEGVRHLFVRTLDRIAPVVTCASAEEAINLLRGETAPNFGVVITDTYMDPGIRGYEFLRIVVGNNLAPNAKLFLASASTEEFDTLRAIADDIGAGFIEKPFRSVKELLATVAKAFGS